MYKMNLIYPYRSGSFLVIYITSDAMRRHCVIALLTFIMIFIVIVIWWPTKKKGSVQNWNQNENVVVISMGIIMACKYQNNIFHPLTVQCICCLYAVYLLFSYSQWGRIVLQVQWNLSITTTFKMQFITCDLFSNAFKWRLKEPIYTC